MLVSCTLLKIYVYENEKYPWDRDIYTTQYDAIVLHKLTFLYSLQLINHYLSQNLNNYTFNMTQIRMSLCFQILDMIIWFIVVSHGRGEQKLGEGPRPKPPGEATCPRPPPPHHTPLHICKFIVNLGEKIPKEN